MVAGVGFLGKPLPLSSALAATSSQQKEPYRVLDFLLLTRLGLFLCGLSYGQRPWACQNGPVDWPRPRLVVSACLGFAPVRYPGELIPDRVVAALRDHVDFVPVCPEVEIGLGVPRPTVRLVRAGEGVRMVQPQTGEDLTERMEAFSEGFLASLGQVEGFILKNRSPSCALRDAKVYARADQGGAVARGSGLFARAVEARFPLLPKEDEGRLTNARIRAHFFTRVFALARLRALSDLSGLLGFHARYKLLLLAYHQGETRVLGRLLAGAKGKAFVEVRRAYEEGFLRATRQPFRLPAMTDAFLHAYGYFKKALSPGEKAHFMSLVQDFREERVPLEAPLALLRSWALRFGEDYLEGQALFEPYPRALMDLKTS